MSPRSRLLAYGALVVGLVGATRASAQAQGESPPPAAAAAPAPAPAPPEDAAVCPWGTGSIINGHRFIFPSFVDSSFVATYLDTRTGVQLTRVRDLPVGQLGTVDLERVGFAETLDGGLQLFDGLGLFGTFTGTATAGTNVSALIFLPVQYSFAFDGGAIFRVLRLKEAGTQVSVRARLGTESGRRFTFAQLLNGVAGSVRDTAEQIAAGNTSQLLVTPFSTFRWGASVAAAQPLSALFSLQASAGVSFENTTLRPFDVTAGSRVDQDFSGVAPSAGLAATADAGPLGVPLALMLEYEFTSTRTKDKLEDSHTTRTQNLVSAGLYYSGRTDLQAGVLGFALLGLDPLAFRNLESEGTGESKSPQLFGGELVLRYVW